MQILIHTSVQIDKDVDCGDDDFGGDEDDDNPLEVFACVKNKESAYILGSTCSSL